jgi:hypothetical protein
MFEPKESIQIGGKLQSKADKLLVMNILGTHLL